jgi:hypothetical protein
VRLRTRGARDFLAVGGALIERTTPELQYLQTRWASLMSYGMTVDLLKEVLPISDDLTSVGLEGDVALRQRWETQRS